ncbi:MAG: hypothetical protein JKY65_01845 [Planctomycetes bacterium]|nr:hypothetical protein [Planctomycetota bacterium]
MTEEPEENAYNQIADKVGLVPNVRGKDNLIQGAVVGVFVLVGAGVGFAMGGDMTGAGLGVLAGLVSGGLISGLVLMVIGLLRK